MKHHSAAVIEEVIGAALFMFLPDIFNPTRDDVPGLSVTVHYVNYLLDITGVLFNILFISWCSRRRTLPEAADMAKRVEPFTTCMLVVIACTMVGSAFLHPWRYSSSRELLNLAKEFAWFFLELGMHAIVSDNWGFVTINFIDEVDQPGVRNKAQISKKTQSICLTAVMAD